MSKNIESVGFVGFGPMGQLMADKMMPGGIEKLAVDPGLQAEVRKGNMGERIGDTTLTSIGNVTNCDVVVFAVPARALEDAVLSVVDNSKRFNAWSRSDNNQLFIDISSVKSFPEGMFMRHGMDELDQIMLAHPLFGPQSTVDGVEGKDIIITKENDSTASNQLITLWGSLGVNTVRMTSDDHDREMAQVQALPFTIGSAFNRLGLTNDELAQLDPQKLQYLQAIADVDSNHSHALTETILGFNPHASKLTRNFFMSLRRINQDATVADADMPIAIGRAIDELGLPDSQFTTPSFENMKKLVELARISDDFSSGRMNRLITNRSLSLFESAVRSVCNSHNRSAIELTEQNRDIVDALGHDR